MQIKTLNDAPDLRGKYVLLRDDFNVQIVDGKITDTFRIEQSMPTIRRLQNAGARVAIVAHLGRPKGARDMNLSLRPIADYMKIPLIDDCLNRAFLPDMQDGDVVLLENVRFYAGEEKNDSDFARDLANGFDIFVNDAFAVSHRAAASIVGVTKFLPSFAGDLLASEIRELNAVMENPARTLMAIVAGSKVSTKIGVLKRLTELADKMIVGGAIGTAFRIATGADVSDALYEPDMYDTILEIIELAAKNNCELLLPIDKGVAKKFAPDAMRADKTFEQMDADDIIMDEGPVTTARNIAALADVKTVIWNGTVGMAEWPPVWSVGTFDLARAIALRTRDGNLFSVVGGGDVVAALESVGVKDDISYVSTGGGAFLEFIQGIELPGITQVIRAESEERS